MKLCLSSQSLDRMFMENKMDMFGFIDYAQKQGISYVELEDKHFASTETEYLARVKAHMDQYGIKCANIAFDCSFGYPTTEKNLAEVDRAEKWMDIGIAVGSPNFRLFAGWMGGLDPEIHKKGPAVEKSPAQWAEMVDCVQKCIAIAKEKGLKIVIENHNHGGFLSSSDDVINLFKVLDTSVASLLLDTGNYVDGMQGIERTVGMATVHIHLKLNNILDDGSDSLYDLPAILSLIINAGFDGTLSMEYEGTQEESDIIPKVQNFISERIG